MENTVAIKECFDFLYLNERHLSAGQTEFVRGLKAYFNRNKELSKKQVAVLFEIRKWIK